MANIIFIIGPTASGKTEIAYLLARKLKAEIISCDSMLVYKQPKIITSKPPAFMLKRVKHHFVGTASVEKAYNVFDYYISASKKIIQLYNNGISTIVCGGSGLYIKALLDGIFKGAAKDDKLHSSLQSRNSGDLYRELQELDPEAAKKISSNDLKRIIRALEVYHLSGEPISKKQKQAKGLWGDFPIKIFGLRFPREVLYERINNRTDLMFEAGAAKEVKKLLKKKLSLTAKKIIGIKEIADFLAGKTTEGEAKELMKKNTRNFAKRQLTWFRKDKRIEWIDADKLAPKEITEYIYANA